jgi:polynucleotide 5'-hydroxyl-kinase GRC3/NOL9
MTDIHIPASWRGSAEAILDHGWNKVLVIGATDCGKSTYCNFLTAALKAAAATVAFVDADVGQKDVGPPATITLAHLPDGRSLVEAEPTALYFVGSVNPIGHFLPMVIGTRRMTDEARTEFVVIDTVGLVEGPGRALNGYQIESLQPDVIVAIQHALELEPTLRPHGNRRIFRLGPSSKAATKSRPARRRAREQAFRAYFAGSREVALDLQHLRVQRAHLFSGEPFEDPHFVYAERTPEGIVAIGKEASDAGRGHRILPADFADNLLCGAVDAHEECRGLGIIERIDFERRRLYLYTPVPGSQIRALQFGDIYLGRDGQELGAKRPGLF